MIATPSRAPHESESAKRSRQHRERRAVYLLLLVAINLALFLPSMNGDFLWDDKYFISENPSLLGGGFIRSFLSSPFGGFSGLDENSVSQDRVMRFYRPLVSLSYWLDFQAWGLNPAAFHLTNILIHIANVISLFYILLGLSFGARPAFFGALLFSLFPPHFENVAWISGRTDLLAFLWAALSTLFFIRFIKKRAPANLVGSAAAYFLALLCKENAVFLSLIFAFFLYKKAGKRGDFLRGVGPYVLALLGWFLLRWTALGPESSAAAPGRTVHDLLAAIGFYGWKLVFPFHLSLTVDPSRVFPRAVYGVLGGVIFIGLGLSVWQAFRRNTAQGAPYWTFASLVFLLLPAGLVVLSAQAISLMAWRFLYLPSAVFMGGIVRVLERRVSLKMLAAGALVVLSAFYTAEIYPKIALFGRDENRFWLGIQDPGREDALARYNIAVKTLPVDEKKALLLFNDILGKPDHPLYAMLKTWILEDLGVYYAFRKEFPKAESYFRELFASGSQPSLRLAFNYSFYLAFAGRRDEGDRIVQQTLRRFPRSHFALTQAARFYVIVEDYGRAAELYGEDYRLFRTRQSLLLAQQAAERRQMLR